MELTIEQLRHLADEILMTDNSPFKQLLDLYDAQEKVIQAQAADIVECHRIVAETAPRKVYVVVTCPPGTPPLVDFRKLVPGSILHSVHATRDGANSVQHPGDYKFEVEVQP